MIVYADVLIFVNTLVNYFLLLATARLSHIKPKTIRMVSASFLGGVSCLYILLPPQPVMLEFLYKALTAFVLCGVAFKANGIKGYLKSAVVLFLITCAYAGVMFAFWLIFRPFGMVINNSVVYFAISPTVLVLCAGVGYLAFSVLWRIFGISAPSAERCRITVFADGKSISLDAIADTGNSIKDLFGQSEIIIADKSQVKALFGSTDFTNNADLKKRYQILPCSTVSGYGSLDSFRCDSANIECADEKITLQKPLLAISQVKLNDDYNAIINPEILRWSK